MTLLAPRIVVAGTHSGVGKTTVATGLMAAFRAAGLRVGAAKVGPDFIDPGYHTAAAGRPSRNLDVWMSGAEAVVPLAGRAGDGCEVLVIEGVMGLFDGAADGTPSSSADVAALLDAPIVLVVDGSSMSRSVAALVHGYATFDPRIRVAGIILNRVGSETHELLLRDALAPLGIPVVGVLRRDDGLVWRDRHLGLVPVVEQAGAVAGSIGRLAAQIAAACDLDAIRRLAASAPRRSCEPLPVPRHVGRAVIALSSGPAFSFMYPDNVEALAAAGAEVVPFDPATASALPAGCHALVAGGGFPEVYAAELAGNAALLADVRARHAGGLVIWAECGGLLWLCERLDGAAMAGIVPTAATMSRRLTLGYRAATARVDTPLGPAGTELCGHEFHYSSAEPAGTALDLVGHRTTTTGGFADERMLASYLHLHLANRPELAERLVATALRMPYPQ